MNIMKSPKKVRVGTHTNSTRVYEDSLSSSQLSATNTSGINESYKSSSNNSTIMSGRASNEPRRISTLLGFYIADLEDAFDPGDSKIKFWHQILLLSLLLEIFILPYYLSFKPNALAGSPSVEFYALVACEAIFILDIYIQAHTGYYHDGNLVRNKKKTRKAYINNKGFWMDLFSLIPFSKIVPLSYTASAVPHAALELHKLLRCSKVSIYVSSLDDLYAKQFALIKLGKVLVIILLVSHVIACCRYWFDTAFDEELRGANCGWLITLIFGMESASSLNSETYARNKKASILSKYFHSIFWTFGVLTGLMEGNLPRNPQEFLLTIVVILFGFMIFTYICVTFFTISTCESRQSDIVSAKINQLKHVLTFHRVSEELQSRAIEYLRVRSYVVDLRHFTDSESNDREALKIVCPSIARDIQVEVMKENVRGISLFTNCSESFLIAVTALLEPVSVPANCFLFREGDFGNSLYIIHSGVVTVDVKGKTVDQLRKGACVGELSVVTDMPRSATVITSTYCMLYRLSRGHCQRVMRGYPSCASHIATEVDKVLAQYTSKKNLLSLYSSTKIEGKFKSHSKQIISALRYASHLKYTNSGRTNPSNWPAKCSSNLTGSREELTTDNQKRASSSSDMLIKVTKDGGETLGAKQNIIHLEKGFIGDEKSHQKYTYSESHNEPQESNDVLHVNNSIVLNAISGGKGWIHSLLLQKSIAANSRMRIRWVFLLQIILLYNWFAVPLYLALPVFSIVNQTFWVISATNMAFDALLIIDIYLNFNLEYVDNSEKIVDTQKCAYKYLHSKQFLIDVLSVLPLTILFPSLHPAMIRMPRLLRTMHLRGHWAELMRYFNFSSRQRFAALTILLAVLYHTSACLYFTMVAYVWGYSNENQNASFRPDATIALSEYNSTHFKLADGSILSLSDPVSKAHIIDITLLQYCRSLYYAVYIFTGVGKGSEPENHSEYIVALIFMLSSFLLTATVVDKVQKLFTASGLDQKEFYALRSRIQLYLKRAGTPEHIHKRVNLYLKFWWSAHRGARIHNLVGDLPIDIKRDILRSICSPALQTLGLISSIRKYQSTMENAFVDNSDIILYGQGETIYRKGDFTNGMYFLLEGHISLLSTREPIREVSCGEFFGTAVLSSILNSVNKLDNHKTGTSGSQSGVQPADDNQSILTVKSGLHSNNEIGFKESAIAGSGCVVVFLNRNNLMLVETQFNNFCQELLKLEQRMLSNKLMKGKSINGNTRLSSRSSRNPSNLDLRGFNICSVKFAILNALEYMLGPPENCFDPDSIEILLWDGWIFGALTFQYLTIVVQSCFPVPHSYHVVNFILMYLVELCFIVDIYIRCYLGIYKYNNKIEDPIKIRSLYTSSKRFLLDMVAILPIFVLHPWPKSRETSGVNNTYVLPYWYIVNLNKFLRLVKIPDKFQFLENQYVKFTMELRVFRLLYYTILLMHTLGCIWFRFASSTSPSLFGRNKWLPPLNIETASFSLQYTSSLFWAFGLMTASSTGDKPYTVSECLFTVFTMISGFFLAAYVIGNFSDIIELVDTDTREFNAKLGQIHHLIANFKLSSTLEQRLHTYYFFLRYHAITQEHILAECLPHSLLTDVRLVHLQPMMAKVAFFPNSKASIEAESVTRMLVSQFVQFIVTRGHVIYKYGEVGSDMFFVFTGILNVMLPKHLASELVDDARIQYFNLPISGSRIERSKARKTSRQTYRWSLTGATGAFKNKKDSAMKKLHEITSGHYIGENSLFTDSIRTTHVEAQTSCVLYKLSRSSLDLVFDRYPEWKQKVLRIVNLRKEQERLQQLAAAEVENSSRSDNNRHADILQYTAKISDIPQNSKYDINDSLGPQITSSYPITRRREFVSHTESSLIYSSVHQSTLITNRWFDSSQRYWRYLKKISIKGIPVQGPEYLLWIHLSLLCTVYMAIFVPYRICFDPLMYTGITPSLLRAVGIFCECFYIVDIWVSSRIRESPDSLELYEQPPSMIYKRERIIWDIIAACPLDRMLFDIAGSTWLTSLRCVKTVNALSYLREINRRTVSHMRHITELAFLYGLATYWTACAYLSISVIPIGYGSDWDAWRPIQILQLNKSSVADFLYISATDDFNTPLHINEPIVSRRYLLLLKFFRGIFFATTSFTKKGKTFTPEFTEHNIFTIIFCFLGSLLAAYILGQIASLYISSINHEVEFRKNHIAVELYLARIKISAKLKSRTHLYMSSLWNSHSGVNYDKIFEELPAELRTLCLLQIAKDPMASFISQNIRPLYAESINLNEFQTRIAVEIAQVLVFAGYSYGEQVISTGNIVEYMYFVIKGNLILEKHNTCHNLPNSTTRQRTHNASFFRRRSTSSAATGSLDSEELRRGAFFGDTGILSCAVSQITVTTVRATDLLKCSSHNLRNILEKFFITKCALYVVENAYREVKLYVMEQTRGIKSRVSHSLNEKDMEEIWGKALYELVKYHVTERKFNDKVGHKPTHTCFFTLSDDSSQYIEEWESLDSNNACFCAFREYIRIVIPHDPLDFQLFLSSFDESNLHQLNDCDNKNQLSGPNEPQGQRNTNLHAEQLYTTMPGEVSTSNYTQSNYPSSNNLQNIPERFTKKSNQITSTIKSENKLNVFDESAELPNSVMIIEAVNESSFSENISNDIHPLNHVISEPNHLTQYKESEKKPNLSNRTQVFPSS